LTGVRRYGELLRTPHVAAITAAALLARIPIGIIGLALVLFLREETGSYATAGAVAAAFAVGSSCAAPYVGRLVDRLGPSRVLIPGSVLHASGLGLLIVMGYEAAPTPLLLLVALLAGASLPPISAVMRTLWPALLGRREELVTTAFALDAVIVELVFVAGPALVALLTAVLFPAAALVLSAVLSLVGTLVFATQPPARAREASGQFATGGLFSALKSPGLLTLVLGLIPIGFTLGATEVTLPAFSEAEGNRALAGVLLAVWSIGSAAGGIAYGASSTTRPLADRFTRCALLLPLSLLPLALAPSFLVMLVLVAPAGAVIAPTLAAGNQLVGDVTPPGQQTEAYTWPLTALVLGVAGGNAAAGAVVEAADWQTAFLVATVAGLLSTAVLLLRRETLRPLAPAVQPA
jgi:MFS family permease